MVIKCGSLTVDDEVISENAVSEVFDSSEENITQSNAENSINNQILSQLELLNSIDVSQALKRVGGRSELYLSLVNDFYKDQQGLVEEVKQLFLVENWTTLYRIIHSLKSNAAYIGAYELSVLCAKFEASLGNNKQDSALFSDATICLNKVLMDLQGVYNQYQVSEEKVDFSLLRLKQGLEQMIPLLKAYDFSVEDIVLALKNMCDQTPYENKVNNIVEYINDIEYEKASIAAVNFLTELEDIADEH